MRELFILIVLSALFIGCSNQQYYLKRTYKASVINAEGVKETLYTKEDLFLLRNIER